MTVTAPLRVLQATVTQGTATYVLIPSGTAYRPFSAIYENNQVVPYCATDNQSGFEIGFGTLLTGPPDRITRDTVILSSNSNALVNWFGTTKQIFAWDTGTTVYPRTFNTTYAVVEIDWGETFVFTGGSTSSLFLLPIDTTPGGFTVAIKNSGTAVFNVVPYGTDEIESLGASASYPVRPGASATLANDGSVWRLIDISATSLATATDVLISGVANHDFLTYDTGGVEWVNSNVASATSFLNAVVGDSGSGGTKGLVPAPPSGSTAAGKFLKADGTFAVPGGGAGTPAGFHVVSSGSSDSLTSLSVVRTQILWNSSSGASKTQTIPDPTLFDGYEVDVFDYFGDSGSHPITITPAGTGTIRVASLGSVANLALQSAYGNLTFRANAALNTWIVT